MSAAPKADFTKPAPEPWGEPDAFDGVHVSAFPVDALPPWLGTWVTKSATFAQVPVDLPATVALGVLSFAASRAVSVEVRPGWVEPTNLYAVTALPPGERKSTVFAMATEPVHVYQRELLERLSPQIARRRIEREVLHGQIEQAKKDAIKGKEGAQAKVHALAEKLGELPELHAPVLIADDCTPEALAILLDRSDERVGIFSAEGGPFELMAGRYSDRSNLDLYLKAHPGDRHAVARVTRDPITLERPLLSMALTVQPTVIAGLAKREGFRGKGLLARFLYSLPTSKMGERAIDSSPVSEDVSAAYRASVLWALRMPSGNDLLRLSPEADAARSAFQAEIEPRLGFDGDLRRIADWAGKLTGAVCRIAGVMHLATHARSPEVVPRIIERETFDHAAQIGNYFLGHAIAAFDAMGGDLTTDLAKRVWSWVQRRGLVEFTAREAQRAIDVDAETMPDVVALLCERCLIRQRPAGPSKPGRPPSPVYEINPRSFVSSVS